MRHLVRSLWVLFFLAGCGARVTSVEKGGTGGASGDAGHGPGTTRTGTGGTGADAGDGAHTTRTAAGGEGGVIECQSGDASGSGVAHVELGVLCKAAAILDCTKTAADLLRGYVCGLSTRPPPSSGAGVPLTRVVGCGFEAINWGDGHGAGSQVYLLSSDKLVGAAASSDATFGPCNVTSYFAWAGVDCASTQTYTCVPVDTLPADAGAYRGCRAPTEPGCATCCTDLRDVGASGCQMTMGKLVSQQVAPCPPGCKPCAPCSVAEEAMLRALPERPECDCSPPSEVEDCSFREGCPCWCEQISIGKERCPGIR